MRGSCGGGIRQVGNFSWRWPPFIYCGSGVPASIAFFLLLRLSLRFSRRWPRGGLAPKRCHVFFPRNLFFCAAPQNQSSSIIIKQAKFWCASAGMLRMNAFELIDCPCPMHFDHTEHTRIHDHVIIKAVAAADQRAVGGGPDEQQPRPIADADAVAKTKTVPGGPPRPIERFGGSRAGTCQCQDGIPVDRRAAAAAALGRRRR